MITWVLLGLLLSDPDSPPVPVAEVMSERACYQLAIQLMEHPANKGIIVFGCQKVTRV